jgi:hypothetical protein
MVKQTSASSLANSRNRASSNTAKSAGQKRGNYFIGLIGMIGGLFILTVFLNIISNLFGPGGPFFNR